MLVSVYILLKRKLRPKEVHLYDPGLTASKW